MNVENWMYQNLNVVSKRECQNLNVQFQNIDSTAGMSKHAFQNTSVENLNEIKYLQSENGRI